MKLLAVITVLSFVNAAEYIWERSDTYGKEYAGFSNPGGVSKYNFNYAKDFCLGFGGQLLQIGSKAEQDYLYNLPARKDKIWIGLMDITGNHIFRTWLNASLVTHTS